MSLKKEFEGWEHVVKWVLIAAGLMYFIQEIFG